MPLDVQIARQRELFNDFLRSSTIQANLDIVKSREASRDIGKSKAILWVDTVVLPWPLQLSASGTWEWPPPVLTGQKVEILHSGFKAQDKGDATNHRL